MPEPGSPRLRRYTTGYGNDPAGRFIGRLRTPGIGMAADVRSIPCNRFRPGFNRESIRETLAKHPAGHRFMGDRPGGKVAESDLLGPDGPVDDRKVRETERFREGIADLAGSSPEGRPLRLCVPGPDRSGATGSPRSPRSSRAPGWKWSPSGRTDRSGRTGRPGRSPPASSLTGIRPIRHAAGLRGDGVRADRERVFARETVRVARRSLRSGEPVRMEGAGGCLRPGYPVGRPAARSRTISRTV